MVCKCNACENLIDEQIKVIDFKANSPFADDIYHFECGFKWTWTGNTSMVIEELPKSGCRCTGGE